jgi:DNA polymerase III sliding clamp (beta) subunit (PCNA family)
VPPANRPDSKQPDEPRPAEGMISFGIGGRQLTTRLIGGEFIRYRSRFPTEFGCRADVPAGPFTEAVRRVSLVADRASPVRLTFGPGRVLIEAQTEGRARAVETVPADFSGGEPVIAFNPHYLLDGLVAAAVPGQPRPHAAGPDSTGHDDAGHGKAGHEDAGSRDAGTAGPDEGNTGPGDPGLLRIEFTSPAKPALITRVTAEPDAEGAQTASQTPPEASGGAEFRYLVVPLRAPVRS